MTTLKMPARDDTCWNDGAWRTEKLRELKAEYGLATASIAETTGVNTRSAYNWFTTGKTIPVNSLRVLMLELMAARNV